MIGRQRILAALVALALLGARPANAADVTVTFVVAAPESTPAGALLWLSGDLPALGSWNGAGLTLLRQPEGTHRGRLVVPRGTALEYKVTRGSWDSVEKDAQGGEIGNRRLTAAADTTVRLVVATWRDQVAGAGLPAPPARPTTLTGDIRHHAAFKSEWGKPRDIWVWLPPGYDKERSRRYPVIYFQDGQNVFDRATSFMNVEWGVDETADRMIRAGTLPPFIAVAVGNTTDRMTEYTSGTDARHGGGGIGKYGRFYSDDLKPFIDRTYRTDPRPAATGVVGSSLGANAALWLGLYWDNLLTRVGALSPAAWFANHDLVRQIAEARGTPLRIWVDIGTAEDTPVGDRRPWVDDARGVRDALLARGYVEGQDLHYEEVEGAAHNEAAWAARVERLLTFLLADLPPPADARR